MSEVFEKADRNKVRRSANRGVYERKTVNEIIDTCRICHVSFVEDGAPFIVPTIHARDGDRLIFHGAKASRMMKRIASGDEICVAFTLLDGLVLARSAFHHSMNYRSVVVFGRGSEIVEDAEKRRALDCLVESVVPGRSADARPSNDKELCATAVAVLQIENASAKIRTGPPKDEVEDMDLPIWAGVIPLRESVGAAEADAALNSGISPPEYLPRVD